MTAAMHDMSTSPPRLPPLFSSDASLLLTEPDLWTLSLRVYMQPGIRGQLGWHRVQEQPCPFYKNNPVPFNLSGRKDGVS